MSNYTADISSELNQIKNAKYGEEVRDSIVSAIRKINTVTEEFTTAMNAIVAEIQEAAADDDITPIDTSVLADYATKEYVDGSVKGSDALYRCDLVQAAVSSMTKGKTVDNTGAIVDADGHYFMSDVLITPSLDITIKSKTTSLKIGYAEYRDDTGAFRSVVAPDSQGAGSSLTIGHHIFSTYHYSYRLLFYLANTTESSANYIQSQVLTTYARLDILEDEIENLPPSVTPDLSGYLTKAEFNQAMVNYADVNDVDPYTVLANSLVWKKKAGTSGAVVDGDYHYYVSSKIICPSRDITIECDMSNVHLGYIRYYNDGEYVSEVLPDREDATNSIEMPSITIGSRKYCYRLLLYLPSSSDMDRTLWLRSQFNTLYGRVDGIADSVTGLEESVAGLEPAYLQLSADRAPLALSNNVEAVIPFDTIDVVSGSAISMNGNYALISESGVYEITAVCDLTGFNTYNLTATLEIKHQPEYVTSWTSDVKQWAYPPKDPYYMQVGPIIMEYDAGDNIEVVVNLASDDSLTTLGYVSLHGNNTYLLIRKL